MAVSENQGGMRMWPSLQTASWLYDWANIFLIGALVIGAISTVLVVWMGNVKEEYLRRELASTGLDAAHAVLQTTILSKEIADATERAALAEQKAAEANLELAKLKAPRVLTPTAQQRVSDEMRAFIGTPFTMGVFNDPESIDLMNQIATVLVAAGWQETEWKSGGDIVFGRTPRPNFGFTFVIGLYVQADTKRASDFGPIVQALASALIKEGVPAKPEVGRMAPDTNNDAIKILVGKKPL